MSRFILSMLVSNESGVLTRVSSLFGRRGFNIDSLSVGETESPSVSRITILATGDAYIREQIILQLEKLHDVKVVQLMEEEQTVVRELMLIKLSVGQEKRSQVLEGVNVFRAKVVDLTPETITVEITGEPAKLMGFVSFLAPYGITELCRTGITAIGRGENHLHYNEEEEKNGEDVL